MSLPYNQKYIVFDIESDGLSLHNSLPWQLAWNVYEGNRLVKSYDEYIDWPDFKVSDFIIKLTGFSYPEYNKRKRPPEEVLKKFQAYLYNPEYMVIGQNLIGFDQFLIATLQRKCGHLQDFTWLRRLLDTRCLGMAYREGLEKPKSGSLLSWQYKILHDRSLKAKVSQLAQLKHFGIEFDEKLLHNATVDCEMTFKIFQELKKKLNL
jgi:DNA polymerase III epsilon subunit-like protein